LISIISILHKTIKDFDKSDKSFGLADGNGLGKDLEKLMDGVPTMKR
jgi:hypothetical protein